MPEVDEFLEHFGVKGMKWGQRKARRAERAAAKDSFYQKKADDILKAAMKDSEDKPRTLVALDGRLVITGQQFVDHMARGGVMDISRTEIFATRGSTGPYQRQNAVGRFRG